MINLIDTTPEAVALLPRPDGESTWTLDPEFVAKVSHAIQREDGWETTMEVVQLAMLAAEKHILELFPIPALAARIAELEAEHEEKDEQLQQAEWLLVEAKVQLEEGKAKTRRNRADLIRQFLIGLKHAE